MSNVTRLNLPVDRILEGAIGKMESLIIIGYTKEGNEYFASTYSDGGDVLWLLERCKQDLLNPMEEDL